MDETAARVRELALELLSKAKDELLRTGHFSAVFALVYEDPKELCLIPIGAMQGMRDQVSKASSANALRMTAIASRASGTVILFEANLRRPIIKEGEPVRAGEIFGEALFCAWETRDRVAGKITCEIHRTAGGDALPMGIKESSSALDWRTGTFSDMFSQEAADEFLKDQAAKITGMLNRLAASPR